jgi:hypothetical protein
VGEHGFEIFGTGMTIDVFQRLGNSELAKIWLNRNVKVGNITGRRDFMNDKGISSFK